MMTMMRLLYSRPTMCSFHLKKYAVRRILSSINRRSLPSVHPAVYEWVIHGVAHSQPVDAQIQRLKPGVFQYVRVLVGDEEADVLWQPAGGEDRNHHDHHLHNLSARHTSQFLARDSMLSALYAIANPSVRLSLERVDQSKTVELRVVEFSPYSSIPLLFAV